MLNDDLSNQAEQAERPEDAAELRAVARRYHELFAQAQDMIYVLDAAGNVLDMNLACARTLGYTREELLGLPISRLVFPEYLPTMMQMLERKIDGMPVTTYEVEVLSRDGRRITLEVNTRLVYQNGRPTEIHGIARDITRRKRTQDEQAFLADVGQVLTSTLDDDAVLAQIASLAVPRVADYCIVDVIEPDGEVRRAAALHADPAYAEMLAELVERYPPRNLSLNGVPKVLRDGGTILSTTIQLEELARAAQDERHFEILRALNPHAAVLVPIKTAGTVSGVITLALTRPDRQYSQTDATMAEELAVRAGTALTNARLYRAARQARLEAEAAVQLRDTFLSVAAHELKTPLTALLGQAQLLQRRDANAQVLSDRERRSVATITAQARRLHRLIGALLDASRIQQGRLSLDREPFDLDVLLQQLIAEIEPTLVKHQLRLVSPAEPLLVNGDELRLEQVVLNLLENAVKYSPAGGEICVKLERDNDEAKLCFSDEGIGVPTQALPHLFSRFYRAGNAEDAYISGMGIGLYVVQEIVSLHGGRVGVVSEEGRGSCFSVWIPLAGSAQPCTNLKAESR